MGAGVCRFPEDRAELRSNDFVREATREVTPIRRTISCRIDDSPRGEKTNCFHAAKDMLKVD
jgi:hypothetical protein